MIKKIKGLTALWLALIMVLTMVPAMSAEITNERYHWVTAYGQNDCWVWYDEGPVHWDLSTDWTVASSGEWVTKVYDNDTVTLPNHPRVCVEDPSGAYAWLFLGFDLNGERLPGGSQYTGKQLHELACGDEYCNSYLYIGARFTYGAKVDVANGSGDDYYAPEESVTIKADAISGKRFKRWKVEAERSGVPQPCVLDNEGFEGDSSSMPALEGFDETAATTTFVMPSDEYRFTFTAEYEDAPVTPSYDWYIPAPEEVEPETEDCWKVNCNKLNVRKAPNLFSGVITKLNRGDCINKGELTEDGKWIRFEVEKGVYGYVSADYVIACDCLDEIDLPMEKIVLCRKLNVRSGAGTSFAKVGNLTRGETVKIVSCDCSGWVKIEYNGGYAWISAAYIG